MILGLAYTDIIPIATEVTAAASVSSSSTVIIVSSLSVPINEQSIKNKESHIYKLYIFIKNIKKKLFY